LAGILGKLRVFKERGRPRLLAARQGLIGHLLHARAQRRRGCAPVGGNTSLRDISGHRASAPTTGRHRRHSAQHQQKPHRASSSIRPLSYPQAVRLGCAPRGGVCRARGRDAIGNGGQDPSTRGKRAVRLPFGKGQLQFCQVIEGAASLTCCKSS